MKMMILGLAVVTAIGAVLIGSRPGTNAAALHQPAAEPAAPAPVPPVVATPVAAPVPVAPPLPAAPVSVPVPVPRPVRAAADNPPKVEELPEFPMLNAKNRQAPLTEDKKTIIAEIAGDGKDRKVVRVGIACEVCLREGPLEQFLCKKGTKEHEAIVRVDLDAELVHLAIIAAGGKPGTPTMFVDPKTEQAKYTAATGSKVNVLVHYKRDGKLHTHPAQDWIWDIKRKAPIQHGWVFAGSVFIKDPDNPKAKPYYGANSGDIFSISNFPYSTLEIPVQISKDDAQLTYEAKTERIPALTSKVWVLLEVTPDKK